MARKPSRPKSEIAQEAVDRAKRRVTLLRVREESLTTELVAIDGEIKAAVDELAYRQQHPALRQESIKADDEGGDPTEAPRVIGGIMKAAQAKK